MKATIFDRKFYWLAYALLLSIIALSLSISFSSLSVKYPELAVGITYDLTLTAPLLYLFIIWKTKIPKTTVAPFLLASVIFASYIIPAEQQYHLSTIKMWLIPILELGVLSFLGFSVYRTVKAYKSVKDKDSDIIKVLREVSQKVIKIPILAKILAFEIAVIYYAFFSWKKASLTDKTFTYHKKSGKLSLFGVIIFVVGIETLVLHYFVAQWNWYVAWFLTFSSAYVFMLLFAHSKAMYQRPIEFIGEKLHIRYGIFGETEIELDKIKDIELSSIPTNEQDNSKHISILADLEHFNTKIHLKEKTTFSGLYGMKEEYKTLLLYIDEAEEFKEFVTNNSGNAGNSVAL